MGWAAVLPWRSNTLINRHDALLDVAEDTPTALLTYTAAVVVAAGAVVAVVLQRRRTAAAAALLAAALTLVAVWALPLRNARVFGVTGDGRPFEDEVRDSLGAGGWVAVAAVVFLVLAAAALYRPPRAFRPRRGHAASDH